MEKEIGNSSDNEATRSEAIAFVELDDAKACIDTIITTSSSSSNNLKANDDALVELRKIFDKYLELPSLLDRHIEYMVNKLAGSARTIMEEVITRDDDDGDTTTRRQFSTTPLPHVLSSLYALSKVRGRKRIQKLLPHQVKDVKVVLETLKLVEKEMQENILVEKPSSEDGKPQLWESIHTLWNWMGILGLVPFDCSVVVDESDISDMIELAKDHFYHAGPTREMAASCLAYWLSRPDFEDSWLQDFLTWSKEVLIEYDAKKENIYVTMGVLQTIVTLLKVSTADRQMLLKTIIQPLWSVVLKISEGNPSNILLRKYLVKWWTRVGMVYLPPRVLHWRYQLGRRSLNDNLQDNNTLTTTQPSAAFDVNNPDETKIDNTPDDFFLIPDEVEEVMGQIISYLTDPSTIVRWSAAKGVGRITGRLPAICAEDVVDSLLELFDDIEKDNNWHGTCLAIAELARRGLLLPHQLPLVIPKLVEAMHYDIPRRQRSVGANVRDAACYTYWAIARAYSPDVLKPFVGDISESVILSFLYDREVNCRRAASAAFQELVGRQGATNFKHGISILTKADYFSLGNRQDSYRSIAKQIAQFDEYRKPMIIHLKDTKLRHWDPNIRVLTAQALSDLTPLEKRYVELTVIPHLLNSSLDAKDFQLRHGAVLGLAEIILSYGESAENGEQILSKKTMDAISELVPAIEKKRLYRGKGGELMRSAVCRLIECISTTRIPLTVPQQVRLLDSVDACLPHPSDSVQDQAGRALFQLTRSYFPVSSKGPSDRLQKRVISKYAKEVRTSANPAATRGFALALGNLPAKLLAPSSNVLDISLACLCRASRPDATVGGEKDAETRRNSIVALARICKTVGLYPNAGENDCVVGITPVQAGHIFTAMFRGLDDYNMERRGDVGSMSRVVAMNGLVTLSAVVSSAGKDDTDYFSEEICQKVVGGLLKQLAEKLDAVRSQAGKSMMILLQQSDPTIPHILERDQLEGIFLKGNDGAEINWADASKTFPLLMKCLDIDNYFDYVISGLVISVGSLTQSVNKHASAALLEWVKGAQPTQISRLGQAFLLLFQAHQHDGRVTLPLLKTLELLLNRMCIESLVQDDTFSSTLITHLKEEVKGCNDVHRLASLINVSLGMATVDNSRTEPTALVCQLLMHSFPRVRRIAAESLYVKLLEEPNFDAQNPVLSLLLDSPWDADYPPSQINEMALAVSTALHVASSPPP